MSDAVASRPSGRSRRILTAIVVLLAFGVLVSLGTWQMQRLAWKEGLLGEIAARRATPAVALADIEAMAVRGQDVDYRPVVATGRFVHAGERHFFATFHGMTGFYVYTPLALADGRFLFVNRGFVPYDNKRPETREAGQVTGELAVMGLARARLAQKPSSIVPDNDLAKNIFYWKDLDAMAASAGLEKATVLPFFVDAGQTPNPGGWPAGGVTQFDLPNNHLQYALTWYGLAAALVVVAGISFARGRARP